MSIPAYLPRIVDLKKNLEKKSCFLLGPRQTGKSSLIRHELPGVKVYNLLDGPTFLDLSQNPRRLADEIGPRTKTVVIDEIQKLPTLLDQVHLLIEEKNVTFLLTGSSARKLRMKGVNLLGGRARSLHLHPFVYPELKERFDPVRAVNRGLIPSIYFSDEPDLDLKAYAGNYLKEEVAQEGLIRNIPAFGRFLEVAACCHGQLINYSEISNDAQVKRNDIVEYFEILKDTLIAHELPAWKKTKKRKAIATSKYYFFDPGVARILQNRGALHPRSPEFGSGFEALLFHELRAYADYRSLGGLSYWRSTSNFEVDFILDDRVAIEVKAKASIAENDLKGLRALKEEKGAIETFLLVSMEERARRVDGIDILPWKVFLEKLWDGEFTV